MSGIRDSWNTEHEHTPSDTSKRAPFRSERSGITYDTNDGKVTAHPDRMVDSFKDADADRELGDGLPPLLLPAHRSRGDDCGEEEIPRFCADCGAVHHVGRTCGLSGCPRCWKAWARKRATTITAKMEALRRYREASEGPGWRGWKFHHLAISPPDGFAVDADDPVQRTMDLLKEVLGEMNVETGALFYHPYRGEDGDDRGFWKHLLPDGEEQSMADTREQLSHEPHFHAVVLSKNVPVMVSEHVEEQTGWVINRITKGEDSDVSIYDKYDLARVTSYCLSHTGIEADAGGDRAAYRYFGEVANFAAEPRIEREMDAAVRSVAPNTLGLEYDDLACATERVQPIGDDREKVDLGAAMGDGSPDEPDEVEVEVERCDGRMLTITAAPAFLDDAEWMNRAENADELREAWRSWRARVDGIPDPDPWDDPGG